MVGAIRTPGGDAMGTGSGAAGSMAGHGGGPQDATVEVAVDVGDKRGISPLLYGIFFEEINHAGDGGLYAEMVKDRSFEGLAYARAHPGEGEGERERGGEAAASSPRHASAKAAGQAARASEGDLSPNPWGTTSDASFSLETAQPVHPDNPTYARLVVGNGLGGITNAGYWGIAVTAGSLYYVSMYIGFVQGAVVDRRDVEVTFLRPGQAVADALAAPVLSLVGRPTLEPSPFAAAAPAKAGGGGTSTGSSGASGGDDYDEPYTAVWFKLQGLYNATEDARDLMLAVSFWGPGIIHLDMVSMFPAENMVVGQMNPWAFRQQLVDQLAALRPRFLRFPGGCFVEGTDLRSAFDWKKAVGPIEARPGHYNLWGYWSTDGLGLYDYMMLAEVLRAEPVWVINSGNSHTEDVATRDIWPWVQSALDSLEFIMGDESTRWGALRVAMGMPVPWALNYMAIGNEDCGRPSYLGNYLAFYGAIKARYPHMRLIANCQLGESAPLELWDYHQYRTADELWGMRHVFDAPDMRAGPHVFVSEYAVVQDGWGTLRGAVAEAGFMLGMERNADVVEMAAYAPLFVNSNWAGWLPDLIVFDNARVFGIPSYWVQQLFSAHAGNVSLATRVDERPATAAVGGAAEGEDEGGETLVAGATCVEWDCASIVVKVVNYCGDARQLAVTLLDDQTTPIQHAAARSAQPQQRRPLAVGASATLIELTSADPEDGNSFDEPMKVAPRERRLALPAGAAASGRVSLQVAPWSVTLVLLTRAPGGAASSDDGSGGAAVS